MRDPPESSLELAAARRIDEACVRFETACRSPDAPRLEDILAEAPEADRTILLPELVRIEAFHRRRAGDAPSAEEYRRRFPDFDPAWLEPLNTPPPELPTSPAARGDADSLSDAPPLPPGYDYLVLLGRGGMGVVYQARHRALNRVVALKMILSGTHAAAEELARFRREAEAIARLQHPNIVQIFEVGAHQGRPYITLEFVEGVTLGQRLGGTPMPPPEAARLLEVLARAVQHAHAAGIVHRDLKPANILLGPAGEAKITDFGLAKVVSQEETQTRTGALVGTPSYMAPEQAAGRTKEIGRQADVYALGAILYEVLVGAPPFRGDCAAATLELVREQEPVPPRRLQPKTPRDLETICLKCLEKDPRKRYDRADALAEDLRRFLAGEPIQARPVSPAERLGRWCRRNPAVAGLLAVVFVLLSGGLTTASGLWWLAEQRRREAEAHLTRASEQRDLARANLRRAREAVDEYCLKVSDDERLRESHRPLRKELLQTAVRFYEQFVGQQSDDADMEAELGRGCLRLSRLTQEIADPMDAIPRAEQARAVFARLVRKHPGRVEFQEALAESLQQLGKLYRSTSQIRQALEATEAAVALHRELAAGGAEASDRQRNLGVSLDDLGQLYRLDGEARAAEKYLGEALDLRRRLVAAHPEGRLQRSDLLASYTNLGLFLRANGRPRDAEKALREALALALQLTASHPDALDGWLMLGQTYNNLGVLYRHTGRQPHAERVYRRSLEIYSGLLAKYPEVTLYHHRLAGSKQNLGQTYYLVRRYDRSIKNLQEAVAGSRRLVARYPEVSEYALVLGGSSSDLAHALRDAGKPEESLACSALAFETLRTMREKHPRNSFLPEYLLQAHLGRAQALDLLGRHSEARQDWDATFAMAVGSRQDVLRLQRVDKLVRSGRHTLATAEAALLAEKKKPAVDNWYYDLACVYSLAAAEAAIDSKLPAAVNARLAEGYASRAVGLLAKALASGEFNNPAQLANLKTDEDLVSLRQREDFKQFVALAESREKPKRK